MRKQNYWQVRRIFDDITGSFEDAEWHVQQAKNLLNDCKRWQGKLYDELEKEVPDEEA